MTPVKAPVPPCAAPRSRCVWRRVVLARMIALLAAPGVVVPSGSALTGSAVISLTLIGVAPPARALVVYDPANHAENLVQTARALYAEIQRSVTNQAVNYAAFAHQLNLLGLDPSTQAALRANLVAIDDAIAGMRQVSQGSATMEALYARLLELAASIRSGGDIAAFVGVIDGIDAGLNRDVALVSAAMTSVASVSSQLDSVLAGSARAVGALQADQIGHHLQAMQVREAMLQRQLQALDLQSRAVARELAVARSLAAEERARRQAEDLIRLGRGASR